MIVGLLTGRFGPGRRPTSATIPPAAAHAAAGARRRRAAAPAAAPVARRPAAAPVAPRAGAAPAAGGGRAPAPAGRRISERVREAARAAGEAARAALGDGGAGGEPARPAALAAPREGGADDLKRIKGVGPKLEELLHSLGIYHFDQIAAWGPAEIAWMDSNLEGFDGRVTRDDWVGQAKLLAAGGETEFSQARRPRRGLLSGPGRPEGMTRMLADKDRIFTNLYGMFDRSLAGRAGARALGRHRRASSPAGATRSSRR